MIEIQRKGCISRNKCLPLCRQTTLLYNMERKELDAYIDTHRRIYDFCNKVLLKIEANYEGVLDGTDCCLEDVIYCDSFIEVEYSYEGDNISSLVMPYEALLSEDVDACAKQIADEIYTIIDEMSEEILLTEPIKTDNYMN